MSRDLVTLVRETVSVVDAAEVPLDLRAAAFPLVFAALRGEDAAAKGGGRVQRPAATAPGSELDGIARLSERLGVPVEVVERVYFVDGDKLEIVVPPNRINAAKSRGTEQIALLVAAGRQGLDLDDDGWTSVDPIRQQCEHFKRCDSANFATTIKDMGDVFTVRGSGRDRKVRMTAPAWQKAAELVTSLVDQ